MSEVGIGLPMSQHHRHYSHVVFANMTSAFSAVDTVSIFVKTCARSTIECAQLRRFQFTEVASKLVEWLMNGVTVTSILETAITVVRNALQPRRRKIFSKVPEDTTNREGTTLAYLCPIHANVFASWTDIYHVLALDSNVALGTNTCRKNKMSERFA